MIDINDSTIMFMNQQKRKSELVPTEEAQLCVTCSGSDAIKRRESQLRA